MSWWEAELDNAQRRRQAMQLASEIVGKSPDAMLSHDLDWLLADQRNHVRALFCDDTGGRGYLPMLVQDRPLPLMLGEVTLLRLPLTRLTVQRGPLLDCSEDQRDARMADLAHTLLGTMSASTALSVEGVPVESAFLRVLESISTPGSQGRLLRLSRPFMHQYIDMPDTLEGYLAQMSKRSRKSVQYSRRKLEKEFDGAVVARRFDTTAMVEEFVKDAVVVSKQTYQWHLLGLGLRDPEGLAQTLRGAAARGAFCSYILYCGGKPVAFMLGYLYRQTFHYVDVGYATTWREWSVGSVLQLLVLEDLYAGDRTPRLFDFSTGYGEHKARFGNASENQVNALLMPRNLRSAVGSGAYNSIGWVSDTVVGTLDRLGLKQRIKRAIRRGSVSKAGEGDGAD